MNTPSPNSMKRDPGRGSAYLSFLKKRCRDFFFFCLLLGVYVAFITLTGIGCPYPFFHRHFLPGLRNEPRGTVNALRSFSGGVSDASASSMPCYRTVSGSFFGPEQTAGLRRFKRGSLRCLSCCFSPFMPGAFITTTRSFLLTLLSGACYNGSILIKGGIYK